MRNRTADDEQARESALLSPFGSGYTFLKTPGYIIRFVKERGVC